ncbi:hypothetical protein CL618_03680 [archaeon]|nr:hypothetical protein [archaeon]|tara:strand:- start:1367 stop:1942 length:576 start_codon:yes stop_codon:yes gene_type:complete
MKKRVTKKNILKFKTAFDYPFKRARGLWNILWLLVPIIGWFALGGYGIRIIKEFAKGKFKKLPFFNFKNDLKLGFFMFLKSIPFALAYAAIAIIFNVIPALGAVVRTFLELFIIPMLTINFFVKETVGSYFEFRVVKYVFDHFVDYIMAVLKSILLFIVFLIMSIILVGIPAGLFTENIFLADFYRRRVKK